MADNSVADIIRGCRRGREVAMQAFYERFHSYALSVALAYASDREDALELVNDSFLKAFGNMNAMKNEESVLPWLRKIVVNTAIDYYRKRRKQAFNVSTDVVETTLEEPYLNDNAIFAQLSAEHIITVLQQLPLPYRLVFSLYVLDGFAHREIAEQLGITESTSRSHLTEANRRLRRALASQTTINHERTGR
ncbi:RNA polymerase sigma factor [Spirosoma fluviale]|nr:RNA polymerase sigma factor [Spirosoma fluviale]